MNKLTHFNDAGAAHMVDVGDKSTTHRIAVAAGEISMLPATLELVMQGNHKKGDVPAQRARECYRDTMRDTLRLRRHLALLACLPMLPLAGTAGCSSGGADVGRGEPKAAQSSPSPGNPGAGHAQEGEEGKASHIKERGHDISELSGAR